MALEEFWNSVRAGRSLMFARTTKVPAASSAPTQRVRTTLWMSRNSVAGFAPDDFSFLSDRDRERLTRSVSGFLDAISNLTPSVPASQRQVARAEPPFLEIVKLLEFTRYEDVDAFRIGKSIEAEVQGSRPAWLSALKFKTGLDSTGDPALWIWAYLADDAIEGPDANRNEAEVRDLLDAAARSAAPDRWPYIRFRSASEMQEEIERMERAG